MQRYNFLGPPRDFGEEARQTKTWREATVRDLNLPAVVSVMETSPCDDAIAKMQNGGFDQLPVVNERGALRGLVTLGTQLYSLQYLTHPSHSRQPIIPHLRGESNTQIPGLKSNV